MTMRTVKGSVKIREKQKIFKETGSPFDATAINSIKVNCVPAAIDYCSRDILIPRTITKSDR